jgi:hypothetical protein
MDKESFRIEDDFRDINFHSTRLEERFRNTMVTLFANPDKSIFISSKNRSEAKAVYRMLNNDKFNIDEVKQAHREATIQRITSSKINVVLAVQDTTGINYSNHKKTDGLGYFTDKTLGINLHTCLAVTPDGLVLGVLDQYAYTRTSQEQAIDSTTNKKRREISEKESYRWLETMERSNEGITTKVINICDREGDMYELYERACNTGKLFLIRVAQNRLTTDNKKIIDEIKKTAPSGKVTVKVPRKTHQNVSARDATLDIHFSEYNIRRPDILKNRSNKELIKTNIIYIKEETKDITNAIEWILITNDEVKTVEDVIEKVGYYVQRWKIERFHYVLKSGCQVEKIQERTYDKVVKLLYMYSVISTFILNITYIARIAPEVPCSIMLNEEEWKVLYCVANRTKEPP